jgi:hypothetical protein
MVKKKIAAVDPDDPDFVDESEAAEFIGRSVAFLRVGRCMGDIGNRTPGPAFYKLGRSIQYNKSDLRAWLAEHRVDPGERPPLTAGDDRRSPPQPAASAPSPPVTTAARRRPATAG